ncbi:MAG: hypothetical protein ACRERC_20670 [Candidatus Binatia bacterium]
MGDCNGDDAVAINELILAVRIALGDAALNDCTAIDRDDNGSVGIAELIAAVTGALQGCDGEIDESALLASARVAVEPILRVYDLGGAGASGGGGARALARAPAGGTAGFSGCETSACTLFGAVTGTEEVCCFEGEFSLTWDNCVYDDGLGTVFTRDGFFTLFSSDSSVCSGAVPAGTDFEAIDDDLFFSAEFFDGSFAALSSDVSVRFTARRAECTDELGLGLLGDGVRVLDGQQQEIAGDGFSSASNVVTDYDSLAIDVATAIASEGCGVSVALDGGLTANDFASRTAFNATFDDFRITQVQSDDALNLDVSGTIGTDCIGEVSLVTTEMLRIVPGAACLSGGRVEATLADGTVAVTYTASGGLDLDFGIDGSIDQRFATCQAVVSDVCTAPEAPGLCYPCTADEQCGDELGCFECFSNCSGATSRCSFLEDFTACADGLF